MKNVKLDQGDPLYLQNSIDDLNHLMNDINHKPQHLTKYIHPHWGSIVGNEKEIRLAVLQDELVIWEQRDTNRYTRDVLSKRIGELRE